MATKAAKSITINATKYELANALGVANGKLQLKAKDVVLDEAEVGNAKAIFVYDHYDSGEGYYVTDAIKDIEGNVLTNADVCSRVKDGAQIYVQVVAASGSNTGKFQLLDKYEHEVHGGGAVVEEHFWSDDNSFSKYVGMTFRLADNFVSAPSINDNATGEFVITLNSSNELYTTGSKTCTAFSVTDLIAAVRIGKTVRIVGTNLLNEDDNHSETIDLVCSCNYSRQGAQVWMSTMYNMKALIFIIGEGEPDTKTSINLVHISNLSSI